MLALRLIYKLMLDYDYFFPYFLLTSSPRGRTKPEQIAKTSPIQITSHPCLVPVRRGGVFVVRQAWESNGP